MSAFQRTKGHNFERAVAIMLRPYWPNAQRGFQCRGGTKECCDVDGTPFYIECKVGARPNIPAAFRQANDALFANKDMRPPLVITKQDRGEVLVTMRMKEFLALVNGDIIDDLGPNAGTRPAKDSVA